MRHVKLKYGALAKKVTVKSIFQLGIPVFKEGVMAVLVSRRNGPQLLEVEGYWEAVS